MNGLDFLAKMSRPDWIGRHQVIGVLGLDLSSWVLFDGKDGSELERGIGGFDVFNPAAKRWEMALGYRGATQ